MKLLLLVFAVFTGVAFAHQDKPKSIRTHVITFGMTQEHFVEWNRGEVSYKSMMIMVKGGGAKVLDANVITTRAGEKTTLESVREEIYPSDYDPPGFTPSNIPERDTLFQTHFIPQLRPTPPTLFETRNAGMILELEPTLGEDGLNIDIWISSEFVDPVGYAKWQDFKDQWGRSDMKFPIYLSQRINTGLTSRDGKFTLAGVFTGKDEKGELDPKSKLVMFVMSEIIEVD